jgi:hypothetical protein
MPKGMAMGTRKARARGGGRRNHRIKTNNLQKLEMQN